MAALKFVAEPDQQTSPEVHELLERLRTVARSIVAPTVWVCWVSQGSHGFSVRLQEEHRVSPYGGRGDAHHLTYSAGGSADFIVADVADWLRGYPVIEDPPKRVSRRRQADGTSAAPRAGRNTRKTHSS